MPRKSIPPEMLFHGRELPRRNRKGDRMITVATYENAHPQSRTDTALPVIRIRGRWLKKLGFDGGERVVITEERNRIVLTLADEES